MFTTHFSRRVPIARNLLERLRDFEHDVLRFMEVESVPFTNNQGENDLRMSATQALTLLFQGKHPDFMKKDLAR